MNKVDVNQNKIVIDSYENPDDDLTVIAGKDTFYVEVNSVSGAIDDYVSAMITINKEQAQALADWLHEKLKKT